MYNFIVDSHCHLDLVEAKGISADEVIKNATANNVKILQTICTKITEFEKIYSYAKKYENVFASVGIHPNNVDEQPKIKAADLIKICNENSKVIGIGETGLDYFYQTAGKENQIESLLEHIEASRKTGLPLIIHNRNSDSDMITILEDEMKKGEFKALLHCFSSSKELGFKALDLGIYVSISGIVTFKNALNLQDFVKLAPLNQILVETDSPYLAPIPHRGAINQPAYTRNVAEFIADLRNISKEELFEITTANFFTLFGRAAI
jgi:TatD DNase family protein